MGQVGTPNVNKRPNYAALGVALGRGARGAKLVEPSASQDHRNPMAAKQREMASARAASAT